MKVNWIALWMKFFGTTEFLGINMGFYGSRCTYSYYYECGILEYEAAKVDHRIWLRDFY